MAYKKIKNCLIFDEGKIQSRLYYQRKDR